MSRAFAAGFAASAAIHAAVLAALWPGPPRGRAIEPAAEPGLALIWAGPPGAVPGPATSVAASDEPARQPGEETPAAATEETPHHHAAAGEAPPAVTMLPLPPAMPTPPRTTPRAGPSLAPRPDPAPGQTGRGDAQDGARTQIGEGGPFLPASIGTKLEPTYPWEARRNRWQGTVVLAVTVSPEGHPVAIEVARSSGHAVLDQAAADAVRQWRFVPAQRNGVAVADRVAVPITFRLRE
ncbi:MAG: TonB family protein [Elioraea sp.]|nr:TonB family protein [Elioraea sp.]MDW8444953.1 TonB family protein [Acetobacteraceae bacterium]